VGVLNWEQAKQYAIARMERELSPNLLYHGISHTRDDVVLAAERLADMEGIQGDSLSLLYTAAWFHDLGFIEGPQNHELSSARIAREVLPGFDYNDEQVKMIQQAILATRLPQSPQNLLEQILADADLDALGRDDFMLLNSNLRRELSLYGKEFSDREWYTSQIEFMESHTYFTASARELRQAGQSKNIEELKKRLEKSDDSRGSYSSPTL
jgi:uncharacterized protein